MEKSTAVDRVRVRAGGILREKIKKKLCGKVALRRIPRRGEERALGRVQEIGV